MDVDVVNLKKKVIEEYNIYLNKLHKGYYNYPYNNILNLISFIQTYNDIDNRKFIYERLINNYE